MGNYWQIPEWQTRNIHNLLHSAKEPKKIKTNIYLKTFYATDYNYAQHTNDYNYKNKYPYEKKTKYMIAFIDD